MKQATLCFLIKEGKICLGRKKRGFGKDKYNGFGGKQESGESLEDTARRELRQEAGVEATRLEKMAQITYQFPAKQENNQEVHVYLVREWVGEPEESNEMTAEWFYLDQIPYDKMWDNDKYWLARILSGERIRAQVVHSETQTSSIEIETVTSFG